MMGGPEPSWLYPVVNVVNFDFVIKMCAFNKKLVLSFLTLRLPYDPDDVILLPKWTVIDDEISLPVNETLELMLLFAALINDLFFDYL